MENNSKDDFAAKAVRALQDAVADVIEEHRRNNRQIVVARDGKPVRIDPYSVRTVREQPASYLTNSANPKK
jgi:hypothetical protein